MHWTDLSPNGELQAPTVVSPAFFGERQGVVDELTRRNVMTIIWRATQSIAPPEPEKPEGGFAEALTDSTSE